MSHALVHLRCTSQYLDYSCYLCQYSKYCVAGNVSDYCSTSIDHYRLGAELVAQSGIEVKLLTIGQVLIGCTNVLSTMN